MRRKLEATIASLLLVVALIPASEVGVADIPDSLPEIDEQPEYSPDGVHLYDFRDHSEMWGRGFNLSLPSNETVWTVTDQCAQEKADAGTPDTEIVFAECLKPHIEQVYWTDGQGNAIFVDQDEDEQTEEKPQPASSNSVSTDTDTFDIYDDIDCCNNKDADAYVVWRWTDSNGNPQQSSAKHCDDQGTSSGTCDESHTAAVQTIKVDNPNGIRDCDGHRMQVEFWDDDNTSPDDQMDISIALGQAYSKIEIAISTVGTTCSDQWWGDRGNTDSGSSYRCHGESFLTFCKLTGDHDTSGDNDDAGLDFTVKSVT